MEDVRVLALIEDVGFSNYIANITTNNTDFLEFDVNMIKSVYKAYKHIWESSNDIPELYDVYDEVMDDMYEHMWQACEEFYKDDEEYHNDEDYREAEQESFEEYFWGIYGPLMYISDVLSFLNLSYENEFYKTIVNSAQRKVFEEGELIHDRCY